MGLILDLAVVTLALVVIGSLALLAWTLAVSAVRSVQRQRESVAETRRALADAESRFTEAAAGIMVTLQGLAHRTAPTTDDHRDPSPPHPSPGEQPDA